MLSHVAISILIPISPPRVDSSKRPHRVNRAHWPIKENSIFCFSIFCIFPVHEKMASDGPKCGREFLFLLIQTLPTFWAERIWILRISIFYFLDPKFLDVQVSRSPKDKIPRFPGSQISRRRRRRTNSQIPTWPLSQRTQGSNTSQGPLLRWMSQSWCTIIGPVWH